MKEFLTFNFDASKCLSEIIKFNEILKGKEELSESKDILPFFKKNKHLSAYIASTAPSIIEFNLLAYEYDLFGDFKADLVVGDSRTHSFLFVEFEEAGCSSIFKESTSRFAPDWSYRVEHGISQVIDWFWKMSDYRQISDFKDRFGDNDVDFNGLVVVGRNTRMLPREHRRLRWRRRSVLCDSRSITIMTYDELCDDLRFRLNRYI